MKPASITAIGLILLAAAACEPEAPELAAYEAAPASLDRNPFDPQAIKLVASPSEGADTRPNNVKTFNAAKMEAMVKKIAKKRGLGAAKCPDTGNAADKIKKCADAIKKDAKGSKGQNGLAASQFNALLDAAEASVATGAYVAPNIDVSGQIVQTCLNDAQRAGYVYDSGAANNEWKLQMCVRVTTTITNADGSQSVLYEYFDVGVKKDVAVEMRNTSDPTDVFPTAQSITKLAIPLGATQNPAFAADLEYKLYAWGNKIQVREYWQATAADANGPIWSKFTQANQGALPDGYKNMFKPDNEACIDMMFISTPPADLAGQVGGYSYCLGRCDNPAIINTL